MQSFHPDFQPELSRYRRDHRTWQLSAVTLCRQLHLLKRRSQTFSRRMHARQLFRDHQALQTAAGTSRTKQPWIWLCRMLRKVLERDQLRSQVSQLSIRSIGCTQCQIVWFRNLTCSTDIWRCTPEVQTRVADNVLLCQSLSELGQLATDTGQSAYRGKQLYDGLMHGARKVDDIANVGLLSQPCHAFCCRLSCINCRM